MSFVVQCDFLQLASYLLSLIVLFYYSALYVIGTIDQKSKAMSRVVRFSDSLALPRASGLGHCGYHSYKGAAAAAAVSL